MSTLLYSFRKRLWKLRIRKLRVSELILIKLSLLGTPCKVSVYLSALLSEDQLSQYKTQESYPGWKCFPWFGSAYLFSTIINPLSLSFIFLHLYPPETKCLRFVMSSGISQSRLFALTFHWMGRMYLYMYTAEHQINNTKEGSVKLNL